MAEKKGISIEGFEAPIGMALRAWLKWALRKAVKSFELAFPTPFAHLMWVMTSNDPEAKPIRDTLKGGIAGLAWLTEIGADMTNLPEWAKEPIEIFAGDLLGQINDQFELRKATYKFPEGYTKPTPEDVDKAFAELKAWIQKSFTSAFKTMPDFMNFATKGALRGSFHRFMATLFASEYDPDAQDDVVDSFSIFEKEMLKTDEDRDTLVGMIEFIDEPQEAVTFFRRPFYQQKLLFEAWKKFGKHEFWPRMWRLAKTNWPSFERWTHQELGRLADVGRSVNTAFAGSNQQRRDIIASDRFTRETLIKYPWRLKELPPEDPLHKDVTQELRQQASKRKWRWLFPTIAVLAFSLGATIIGAVTQQRGQKPPTVSIVSPTGGSFKTAPVVIGQAEDDEAVVRIEVQANNGLKKSLYLIPNKRVNFRWTPDQVFPGMNTILIWAEDGHRKVATATVQFYVEKPEETEELSLSDSLSRTR